MRAGRPAELIVGSAQLGLAYGAANHTGKPDHFICGAPGQLGRKMAWALGEAGATVILNGRNANRLSAFANELSRAGIAVECAAFNMMDFAAFRQFFTSRHRIDVLIANAVTMTPTSLAAAVPEDFDQAFRSTVAPSFEAVRAARPALARAVLAADGGWTAW